MITTASSLPPDGIHCLWCPVVDCLEGNDAMEDFEFEKFMHVSQAILTEVGRLLRIALILGAI